MTPARQDELRTMLEERRRVLAARVREKIRTLRDTERVITSGRVTACSDDPESEDIDLAMLRMQAQTMVQVQVALERLSRCQYGTCEVCDKEIAAKRLEAFPFATRCRSCQERAEEVAVPARSSSRAGFARL